MRPSLSIRRHPTPGAVRNVSSSVVSDAKPFSTPLLKTLLAKPRQSTSHGFQTKPCFEEGVNQAATIEPVTLTVPVDKDLFETPYNWYKNWYPIQTIFNLEKDRPNRLQLLNQYFVVWKGKDGNWVVMDDQCPHRFAPLSEGRVEKDGNLSCSYHAWRFDETGKCVRIPHAEDEKAHETACNSTRSSVKTYPCKTRAGILWVFPDASDSAFEESKNHHIMMDDELADHCEKETIDGDQWFQRVLPYNYDVIMENILDPSHFIVSHHGAMPLLDREGAKPLHMRPARRPLLEGAFATYEHDAVLPLHSHGIAEFRLPITTVLQNANDFDDPSWIRQHAMIVPLGKHKCRAWIYNYTSKMIAGKKGSASKVDSPVMFRLPAWQMHSIFNDVLDGDVVFLQLQDKILRRKQTEFRSSKAFYIPSSSDALVMLFRRWFEIAGKSGDCWGNATRWDETHDMLPEQYLDRYTQHVLHCKACQNALKRLEFLGETLKWVGFACLAAATLMMMGMFDGTPLHWKTVIKSRRVLTTLGSAVGLFFTRFLLLKLIQRCFYYKPWAHPDNN